MNVVSDADVIFAYSTGMNHTVLIINEVANYVQADKDKKMQYATRNKIIETDPYWIAPYAFKTQDMELYTTYRLKLSLGARRYWDKMLKIDHHTPVKSNRLSCSIL